MSDQQARREYHQPVVLRIELEAEEVMAVGCKVARGIAGVTTRGVCGIAPCSTTTGS